MTYTEKLKKVFSLEKSGEWAERISAEIRYLYEISKTKEGKYDAVIEKAADSLLARTQKDGAVTKSAVLELEEQLKELKPIAKSYTELFLSHAHIDMNWMWGYNETASVTVDTFRTVLNLMREYPSMTFCQSQASTYEMIEKYCPSMIEEIKEMIRQGRWEVTASQWVEPDDNMPCGESFVRHVLETRKYLSELLSIAPETMNIDFVPDTFGHNINLPEIFNDCGMDYFYHCRGKSENSSMYYYVSPSGKKTLSYMEYAWYNGTVTPEKFCILPKFCAENGMNTYLCIYGIGDHGGGPSRRDIERIIKYMSWPYTPNMKFGTMHEFFKAAEESGTKFPEITEEENCIFTGCYTTQTRIKAANKIGETRTIESEALSAEEKILTGSAIQSERYDRPWKNILFNQFHDILPGSGTVETREYAMGKFQETLAAVNNYSNNSLRALSAAIDTSAIKFDEDNDTVSEGGGGGFTQSQSEDYKIPATERGRGSVRAFNIFNTTARERFENVYITVWDYPYGFGDAVLKDAKGNVIDYTLLEQGKGYWGHRYSRIATTLRVPALGYTTVVLSQKDDVSLPCNPVVYEHSDEFINEDSPVLENEYLKAVFDYKSCRLTSLTDKTTGKELINEPSCFFRMITEDPKFDMTAWRVGPTMTVSDLNLTCGAYVEEIRRRNSLSYIKYKLRFGVSELDCKITLAKESRTLEFSTRVDWKEMPEEGVKIPQLSFAVPVSYKTENVICDIPFGKIERTPKSHDIPALSYIDMKGVGLISETKYGFRFTDNTGSVTLIRSSYDPDPYPEIGIHNIRLGVTLSNDVESEAETFRKPLYTTAATKHGGTLPTEKSALSVKGEGVYVACVKNSEDSEGIIVRAYNTNGKEAKAEIILATPAKKAFYTNALEKPTGDVANIKDGRVLVSLPAYSTVTVKVTI